RERSRWKYCNAPFKNGIIRILEKYKMVLCRLKPRARLCALKPRGSRRDTPALRCEFLTPELSIH
ncbi:hypothetical protein, partial [Leptospira alstonii]|uniref:hypothetical protein n=1 Tax=Leptospira alstonii TaxID=28452 RepID=UPI001E5CEF12